MSVRAMAWAFDQRVGRAEKSVSAPSAKLVLLKLADHSDDRGRSYPSIGLIAEDTELDERTVRRALDHLEARGLIRKTKRGRGHEYHLQTGKDEVPTPGNLSTTPGNLSQNSGQVARNSGQVAHRTIRNCQRTVREPGGRASASPPPCSRPTGFLPFKNSNSHATRVSTMTRSTERSTASRITTEAQDAVPLIGGRYGETGSERIARELSRERGGRSRCGS